MEDIGLRVSSSIAGFLGAIVSLAVERPAIGWTGYLASLVSSIACANYLPPLVHHFWAGAKDLDNSLAFLSGVLGMYIVAGLIKIGIAWSQDPVGTWKQIKKSTRRDVN